MSLDSVLKMEFKVRGAWDNEHCWVGGKQYFDEQEKSLHIRIGINRFGIASHENRLQLFKIVFIYLLGVEQSALAELR